MCRHATWYQIKCKIDIPETFYKMKFQQDVFMIDRKAVSASYFTSNGFRQKALLGIGAKSTNLNRWDQVLQVMFHFPRLLFMNGLDFCAIKVCYNMHHFVPS